jgi:peroxiredoxin
MPRNTQNARYRRAQDSPVGALEAHQLRHSLIGLKCPRLAFHAASGEKVCLGGTASLAAYIYPGSDTSEEHGSDTPLADAEEHRAFRDAHDEIAAEGFAVAGISSQSVERQREAIIAHQLPQKLASDHTLRLAELLRLPTFRVGDGLFYQRLTMVLTRGRITQVIYRVAESGRHADRVIDWLNTRAR